LSAAQIGKKWPMFHGPSLSLLAGIIHIRILIKGTGMVPEMPVIFNQLTQLLAQGKFTDY
jgi:hypothetical protein